MTETVYIDRCTVDTIVKVESDTASLQALLECDSLGNVLMTELTTLQGQRVSVAPVIKYVTVTGENGNMRRSAYMAVVAMADSLQEEVSMLQETIKNNKQSAETIMPTASPFKAYLWGLAVGALITIGIIIFIKK